MACPYIRIPLVVASLLACAVVTLHNLDVHNELSPYQRLQVKLEQQKEDAVLLSSMELEHHVATTNVINNMNFAGWSSSVPWPALRNSQKGNSR